MQDVTRQVLIVQLCRFQFLSHTADGLKLHHLVHRIEHLLKVNQQFFLLLFDVHNFKQSIGRIAMLMRWLDLQVSQQSSQLQLSLLQVRIRSLNEIGVLITSLGAEPDCCILHYQVKIHHQLES